MSHLAGVQEVGILPAASTAMGSSHSMQQVPTVHPSALNIRHTIRCAKAATGPAPQQHTSQAVQSPGTGQQALRAATAAAPGAKGAQTVPPGAEPGIGPAYTGKPGMPAGTAALNQSARKQKCPKWPGSCSQGAVADANRLHGVAAVALRPRSSKSCSAGKRQTTAKKLVFQQLSLAQQATSSSACKAPLVTAAHSAAKDDAAQQPVVAIRQAASAGAGTPTAKQQAGQDTAGMLVLLPAQTGVKAAEACDAAGPQGVSGARQEAAAASQKKGDPASDPNYHGPQAGSDVQCPHPAADKASSGRRQQWETAICKLRSLAQKHSQDSQEKAVNPAPDMTPEAGALQEQPVARKSDPAALDSHFLPVACGSSHVEALQRQVSVPGRPAALVPAPPDTGQLQLATTNPGTEAQASQAEAAPKPGAEEYTSLSHLRGVMRQQKEQQLETDSLMDTGQKPGSGMTVPLDQQQVQKTARAQSLQQQHLQQVPSMKPRQPGDVMAQQPAGCHAGHAHKRKRVEADAGAKVKLHSTCKVASHMPSAQVPCKRPCLSASGHERPHMPAAQGPPERLKSTETHSWVCGKHPADAAQPSHSGVPGQRAPTGPQQTAGAAPLPCQLVAWPPHCEPNLACLGRHGSQQLPHALPVPLAMQSGHVPAGKALWGEAAVLVPVGQQDKSQGGSEPQQGGLRLDLSSEEDPLLCTQKLPSSQGVHSTCRPHVVPVLTVSTT